MDGEEASRYLQAANDLYKEIAFRTDSIYNDPAPEPWVSFLIGGIFFVAATIMWVNRLKNLQKALGDIPLRGTVLLRAMISVAIDSDEPFYTIISFAAFSFLFLGGLQLDYEITFSVMMGTFALSAAGDSIRVLLAFSEATSLADVVFTSDMLRSKFRNVSTELKPSNVYEDLARGKTIVIMVFITQVILISFVVTDIYNSETHTCPDGTGGCPVVGTFGSWGLYVLGIFMACVFLLGPKTAFGQSEQNPSYWLQLLLAAKQTGAMCTWNDPVADRVKERVLTPNDWRIWVRFFMSWLINGVGFHILVHALPIQVAGQSSLTGVVFRAVGMMYLVDLDDTPGYTLKLVESTPEAPVKEEPPSGDLLDEVKTGGNTDVPPEEEEVVQAQPSEEIKTPASTPSPMKGASARIGIMQAASSKIAISSPNFDFNNNAALAAEAQRIIEDAKRQLEALATRGGVVLPPAASTASTANAAAINNPGGAKMATGMLVMAGGAVSAQEALQNNNSAIAVEEPMAAEPAAELPPVAEMQAAPETAEVGTDGGGGAEESGNFDGGGAEV